MAMNWEVTIKIRKLSMKVVKIVALILRDILMAASAINLAMKIPRTAVLTEEEASVTYKEKFDEVQEVDEAKMEGVEEVVVNTEKAVTLMMAMLVDSITGYEVV
mgnify:CR=1 FL=1